MHGIDLTTVDVMAVVFIATFIRSALGFGEALIAVPLLALRIPVLVAAPLAVLVSVTVAGIVVVQDWQKIEMRAAGGLVVSSLFGLPLGVLLLLYANEHALKAILGVIIASFAAYSLLSNGRLHLRRDHKAWLLTSGFCSGVLGGAYGMNGPPLVIYGALRRWPPQRFRATLQGYFLPASLLGLAGYVAAGLWSALLVRYFLLSLPGALVAIWLGRTTNRRLHGDGFYRAVYAALIVLGGVLLAQAMLG